MHVANWCDSCISERGLPAICILWWKWSVGLCVWESEPCVTVILAGLPQEGRVLIVYSETIIKPCCRTFFLKAFQFCPFSAGYFHFPAGCKNTWAESLFPNKLNRTYSFVWRRRGAILKGLVRKGEGGTHVPAVGCECKKIYNRKWTGYNLKQLMGEYVCCLLLFWGIFCFCW